VACRRREEGFNVVLLRVVVAVDSLHASSEGVLSVALLNREVVNLKVVA
jgi:hypothetical protein